MQGQVSMDQKRRIAVTVVVSTKNEELAIGQCLKGLQDFQQVIVVDSNSIDATQEIARKSPGVEVVNFTWSGTYPKKKQWCLENLSFLSDWVLFVDADEGVSPELLKELRSRAWAAEGHVAFDVQLDYEIFGKRLKHGHRVVKRALMKVDGSVTFPRLPDLGIPGMGELEGHYQPLCRGSVGRLEGRLWHRDPDPFTSWLHRHNKYSDWEAGIAERPELSQAVRELRSRQGRLFQGVPLKPVVFFVFFFIIKRGFLDGRPGLDYALALSFYYWQIDVKRRELRREGRVRPSENAG
ncbi:glycosyltransferase family 2 protein [Nocardioides sp. 31GB23]|uniref:glycosyltransferase family 2 protein n=1 Tax=Nocardioides sp. 31GB23 TaxID=3156065 RepID=UPI0032AF3AEC